MPSMFNISVIHLWNRTKSKAVALAAELEGVKSTFKNKNLKIFVHNTVRDCVSEADIIVTATNTSSPLLFADMLKSNAHINGKLISVDLQSTFLENLILTNICSCRSWCKSSC